MISLSSEEGYEWTKAKGVRQGLKTLGVVEPPEASHHGTSVYDVIVIGAGWAGLTAARDISEQGFKVLLLEARDRVGGRTWTANVEGYLYEMGGTWVSHTMGHLQKNMERYGFANDYIATRTKDGGHDYYSQGFAETSRNVTHEEAGRKTLRAWNLFVNVDGENGRKICPLPFAPFDNIRTTTEQVTEVDRMSASDRLEQIADQLDYEERMYLESLLLHISGATLEKTSVWDMVRSHALMGFDASNFEEVWLAYRLRRGQSAFARAMFDDAVENGIDYKFKSPVRAIDDECSSVKVTTISGNVFSATRVVCTVPLNVIHTIEFSPPLSKLRTEAVESKHVNRMTKIHAEVKGDRLSWNGVRYPGKILYAYADGRMPNGNTHVLGFGADEGQSFIPEQHPEKVVGAFKEFDVMEIERLVFHNWNTDPYSQAGPAFFGPGYASKYQEELLSPHGNIHFASGDYARGWRSFIEGAMSCGSNAATEILRGLKSQRRLKVSALSIT